MDITHKISVLRTELSEEENYKNLDDESLLLYLSKADAIIRNRIYGMREDAETATFTRPECYAQIEIAKRLLFKIGTEGETTHNENGINVSWSDGSGFNDIFRSWGITPYVGGVKST